MHITFSVQGLPVYKDLYHNVPCPTVLTYFSLMFFFLSALQGQGQNWGSYRDKVFSFRLWGDNMQIWWMKYIFSSFRFLKPTSTILFRKLYHFVWVTDRNFVTFLKTSDHFFSFAIAVASFYFLAALCMHMDDVYNLRIESGRSYNLELYVISI